MTISVSNTAGNSAWQVLYNAVNQMAALMSANVVTADATANGSVTIGNAYFLGIFATSNLVANTIRGGNNTVSAVLNISSNVVINTSSQLTIGSFVANSTVFTTGTISINSVAIYAGNSTANLTINSTSVAATTMLANQIGAATNSNVVTFISDVSIPDLTANTIAGPNGVVTFTSNVVIGNLTVNNFVATSIALTSIGLTFGSISNFTQNLTSTALTTIDSFPFATYVTAEYLISVIDHATSNVQVSKMIVVTDGSSAFSTEYQALANATVLSLSTSTNATHVLLQAQTVSSTNTSIKGARIALQP